MELQWLFLIIPAAYIVISVFFLCFPNILHKRHQYSYSLYNQLLDSKSLICIAHRGGAFEGPQNTVELFKKNEHVCHKFELDVCITKDKKMVVNHDVSLKRTCGVDKDITELNYDELPRLLEEYEPYGRKQFMKT